MSDHLTPEQIENYGKRRLSSSEWTNISDHIQECAACAERLYASFPTPGLPLIFESGHSAGGLDSSEVSTQGSEHLTFEEMEAYLDKPDDPFLEQIVAAHIGICPICSTNLEELRQIRLDLQEAAQTVPIVSRKAEPVPTVPLQSAGAARMNRGRLADRYWRSGALAAAVALLLIGFLVKGWRSDSTMDHNAKSDFQQIARLKKERDQALVAQQHGETQIAQLKRTILAQVRQMNRQKAIGLTAPPHGGSVLPYHTKTQQPVVVALEQQRLDDVRERLDVLNPAVTVRMGDGSNAKAGDNFFLLNSYGTYLSLIQPILSWTPLAGAEKYRVRIVRTQEQEVVAAAFLVKRTDGWHVQLLAPETLEQDAPKIEADYVNFLATGTDWQVPRPLRYGQGYTWDVIAYRKEGGDSEGNGDHEQPVAGLVPERREAKFAVLNEKQVRLLTQAREQLARHPLRLCRIYLRLGLLDEAGEALKDYLQRNPTSKSGRQLLEKWARLRSQRSKS
jgi:hypothetical protein